MGIRSDRVWRALAAMSILALAGYAAWRFLPDFACTVPDNLLTDEQLKLIRLRDQPDRLEKPNCPEFWFYRYQSLVGALIALIAAWIATIPARGQLREMSRQSAASARLAMVESAKNLENEVEFISSLQKLGSDIGDHVQAFELNRLLPGNRFDHEHLIKYTYELDRMWDEYHSIWMRQGANTIDIDYREGFLNALDELHGALDSFNEKFSAFIKAAEASGDIEGARRAAKDARVVVAEKHAKWSAVADDIYMFLLEETDLTWRRAQAFGKQAFGLR